MSTEPSEPSFLTVGMQTITQLAEHLAEIDANLSRYAFHLHKLQPFHNGRITIAMVQRQVGAAEVPTAGSWTYIRSARKWHFAELKMSGLSKRNKRSGGFYETAKTVSAILANVQTLLERRALTMKRFNDFQDAVRKAADYRANLLSEMSKELDWYDREHATLVDHPTDSEQWAADDDAPVS